MVTLLMSLTSFSQTGTTNCKIHIPCDQAKKITADLLSGDQAKAELLITNEMLATAEQKISLKDSIIMSYTSKCDNYQTQIDLYKQKEDNYKKIVLGLETSNRISGAKVKAYRMITIVLSAATIASFLSK